MPIFIKPLIELFQTYPQIVMHSYFSLIYNNINSIIIPYEVNTLCNVDAQTDHAVVQNVTWK